MKTQLRRFNEIGIESFRKILNDIRNGEFDSSELSDLLSDSYTCDIVSADIKIEQKEFETKKEIVKYLSDTILRMPNYRNLLDDVGLWSWLSAFYFDSLCPEKDDGSRKPGADDRHILNKEEWSRYYRHLLVTPVRFWLELGELANIYLIGTPDKHGDLMEQLASRQEVATCKGIIEAATILYWDNTKNKLKTGVRNKDGAGVLRRFARPTFSQFSMTYDLNSMNGTEILTLLPAEYDKWKTTE